MSQKQQRVRFVGKEKKREWCSELVDDYLNGNNALVVKLGRGEKAVQINITPEDRDALINRVVREPTSREVVAMTSALLTTAQTAWQNRLTPAEEVMCHEWDTKKKAAKVDLHFVCFPPGIDPSEPRPGFAEFYEKFAADLLNGNSNKRHLKDAFEQNLPIEVGYTMYKGEMIRGHVVLEPYPVDQKGADMFAKAVK